MRLHPLCPWPLGGFAVAVLAAVPLLASGDPLPAGPGAEMASVRLADGFDFPVGRPDAVGYHKARGMVPNGHLGEDWDGDGGGNTDLGDPIYCMGAGIVVLAGDMHMGWGNVVMVRHSFRDPAEGDTIKTVDSLYGHLDTILVRLGDPVARGQQIATMGTAHGLYDAHLHFEVRKNINIGMFRSSFARDYSNYYDPTAFITARRHLHAGGSTMVAVNTFRPYPGATETNLSPADGAYELGINRSPERIAAMQSSHLKKSAFSIKPRDAASEKINQSFRVDRYSDMMERNPE